ncbi:MAG: hypothetical protein ACLQVG_01090 [Terriglobia bacterium]
MELVIQQFSISTAEDEKNYFTEQPASMEQPTSPPILPAGQYRVIDNKLYRVVPGIAPTVPV